MSQLLPQHEDYMSQLLPRHEDYMSQLLPQHEDYMSQLLPRHEDYMSQLLPQHEDYMSQLLPQHTAGRYFTVKAVNFVTITQSCTDAMLLLLCKASEITISRSDDWLFGDKWRNLVISGEIW